MTSPATRRTVLAAALAAAATAAAPAASAAQAARTGIRSDRSNKPGRAVKEDAPVEYHAWTSSRDWRSGTAKGVRIVGGSRPAIAISAPASTTNYTDPHTGQTSAWEASTWTSPQHAVGFGATELVASWNAQTPAGTWIQVELHGTYSDGTQTPWYVMGRWAAGDTDIRRTTVDGQSDDKSSIFTDTFAIDDAASGLRLDSYQLRMTLYRKPGTTLTPLVWRTGAMASAIPDRFTVPESTPGLSAAMANRVPQYSQDLHIGQYPEFDNGGEAWCSPTSSQMVIEFHGRKPTAADLSWVDPAFADPSVDHAARFTYDWQYEGCGNWPFNAAYATTYRDMEAVVTRLRSLNDAERLIAAGIPIITSQSFLESELDGAGYGTSGHLMCVVGFTAEGDVIANDPASRDDAAVHHVYKRRQFENIWLRTKRLTASGSVASGSGGVCYVYWPRDISAAQRAALASVGIR